MKRIIFAIAVITLLTSAHYQKSGLTPGGSWTFRSKQYTANKFLRHRESTTIYDTTQKPRLDFIIDFHAHIPSASGKFKVIQGMPMAEDQIDIGIGIMNGTGLAAYSTNGGNGKETIDVIVSEGKMKISGTGIELANQKDPKDTGLLSFDITIQQ